MGKESVGQKRAAARRENREQREKLAAMTNQQLVNYLNGFDGVMLDRLEKAFAKVRERQRRQELEAIDEQIAELAAKRDRLQAGS